MQFDPTSFSSTRLVDQLCDTDYQRVFNRICDDNSVHINSIHCQILKLMFVEQNCTLDHVSWFIEYIDAKQMTWTLLNEILAVACCEYEYGPSHLLTLDCQDHADSAMLSILRCVFKNVPLGEYTQAVNYYLHVPPNQVGYAPFAPFAYLYYRIIMFDLPESINYLLQCAPLVIVDNSDADYDRIKMQSMQLMTSTAVEYILPLFCMLSSTQLICLFVFDGLIEVLIEMNRSCKNTKFMFSAAHIALAFKLIHTNRSPKFIDGVLSEQFPIATECYDVDQVTTGEFAIIVGMPYIHFVHAYEAGIIPELPSELYLERRRVDHGDAKDSVTQNAFAAALARNPSQHDVMTLKMAIANLHLHKVPMDRVETHTVGEDIPLITFYLEGYIFNGPSEFLAVMSQIYHETWTYTTNDGIEVDEKDYISPKPCKCETIERLTCKHPLWMPRDDPACIQVHEPIDSDIDSDSDSDSDSDTDM